MGWVREMCKSTEFSKIKIFAFNHCGWCWYFKQETCWLAEVHIITPRYFQIQVWWCNLCWEQILLVWNFQQKIWATILTRYKQMVTCYFGSVIICLCLVEPQFIIDSNPRERENSQGTLYKRKSGRLYCIELYPIPALSSKEQIFFVFKTFISMYFTSHCFTLVTLVLNSQTKNDIKPTLLLSNLY